MSAVYTLDADKEDFELRPTIVSSRVVSGSIGQFKVPFLSAFYLGKDSQTLAHPFLLSSLPQYFFTSFCPFHTHLAV